MKPRFDIRFCLVLMFALIVGASCSSAGGETGQVSLEPTAEAKVQEQIVQTEAPVPEPVQAGPVRKRSKEFTPPSVIQPEPQPQPRYEEPGPIQSEVAVAPVERRITVPSGTLIPIRMIDSISSEQDLAGQTFRASLDGDVIVRGETVIPRRSTAFVKLVEMKAAGELTGKSEITVQLESVVVNGKRYTVESNPFLRESASQTAQTAKSAGIGAAIGAVAGAIAGGRKGALIGAGVGAGSGVAIEAASKSEHARIESETRVDFRLEAPLTITIDENEPID
jgi:hypothetical protein